MQLLRLVLHPVYPARHLGWALPTVLALPVGPVALKLVGVKGQLEMGFAWRHLKLLVQVAPRYREAGYSQKSHILDEFVAATGYSRKYAIVLLTRDPVPQPAPISLSHGHDPGITVPRRNKL